VYTLPPGAAHVRGKRRAVSDDVASLLDNAIRGILDEQLKRAHAMLTEHREKLEKLVDELLEKKTLFSKDINKLFGDKPSKATA